MVENYSISSTIGLPKRESTYNCSVCYGAAPSAQILDEKERNQKMSVGYCLVYANGYVLASDSRSSIISSDCKHLISWEDNFRKIVYLPKTQVGVVATGANRINGVDITNYILALDDTLCSIKNVEQIAATMKTQLQQDIQKGDSISLCLAGVNNKTPVSYFFSTSDNKIEPNILLWKSEPTDVDIISQLYLDNGGICVDFRLTLNSAINFLSHLVETAINVSHFHSNVLPTIGGDVQILAVDNFGNIVERRNC